MFEGITILNQYENVFKISPGFNEGPFGLGVLFIIIAIGLLFISKYVDNNLLAVIVCGLIIALFFSGIGLIISNTLFADDHYRTEYEVTIDDSVSMTDFYNKYEIIEQRGEIYVICEKEES